MATDHIFRFSDYKLYPSEYRLYKGTKQIRLRPKAFEALLYLVERHGQLVRKTEMLENLWPDVVVTENTLNKCIDEARRALKDNAYSAQFIETVPKLGFRFINKVERLSSDQNESENGSDAKEIIQTRRYDEHNGSDKKANISAKRNLLISVLIFCGLLVLTWFLFKMFAVDSSINETYSDNRIAVLPFINYSPDPQDIYFTDGMTEELISALSKISGLKVIARASIMQYKDQNKNLPQIAQKLNVKHLLDGSVRKTGSTVRITVQLIDAENQVTLWSQDYDRELKNVFVIQTDIAQNVAATSGV